MMFQRRYIELITTLYMPSLMVKARLYCLHLYDSLLEVEYSEAVTVHLYPVGR